MSDVDLAEKKLQAFLTLADVELDRLCSMISKQLEDGKHPIKIVIPQMLIMGLAVEFGPVTIARVE